MVNDTAIRWFSVLGSCVASASVTGLIAGTVACTVVTAPAQPGVGYGEPAGDAEPQAQMPRPAEPEGPASGPVEPEAGPRVGDTRAGPAGALFGMLHAHNIFRADHCAPALAWSETLAADAQAWAETLARECALMHDRDTSYGENLAWFRPRGRVDGRGVVTAWYGEVADYDFSRPGFSQRTGHFTQLVWTTTERLGCGVAECGGGEVWVCRYDSSGNYRGQYRDHVLPTGCR